jgi:ATP-binding cassette subfamily C (CFTR/MRP) protein 1
MVQEWLGTTLGLMSAALAIILVGVATQLNANSGFAGAGLIALMNFSNFLLYLVVNWTDLETSIGAVSRLKGFIENVTSEHRIGEDTVPSAAWPEKGEVRITGVSASYQWVSSASVCISADKARNADDLQEKRQLRLALRDIDVDIKHGEKVAVCGRTGRSVRLEFSNAGFNSIVVENLL